MDTHRLAAQYHKPIRQIESALLLKEALHLGIEYPTSDQKPEWWNNTSDGQWLTHRGQIGLNKLIREERRKNIEWWVKIVTPLIGAAISLIGLIIALITIVRK